MIGDDDSLVSVVVLPALAGGLGFVVLGPFGFFAGAVFVLVLGATVEHEDEKDERIAELEVRVAELEAERESNGNPTVRELDGSPNERESDGKTDPEETGR